MNYGRLSEARPGMTLNSICRLWVRVRWTRRLVLEMLLKWGLIPWQLVMLHLVLPRGEMQNGPS